MITSIVFFVNSKWRIYAFKLYDKYLRWKEQIVKRTKTPHTKKTSYRNKKGRIVVVKSLSKAFSVTALISWIFSLVEIVFKFFVVFISIFFGQYSLQLGQETALLFDSVSNCASKSSIVSPSKVFFPARGIRSRTISSSSIPSISSSLHNNIHKN